MAKVTDRQGGSLGRLARSLLNGRGRLILGLGAAGVLLVLVSGMFGTASQAPAAATGRPRTPAAALTGAGGGLAPTTAAGDPVLAYEALLDRTVAQVLDQVRGAGTVTVAVTVSRSPSQLLVHNLSTSRNRQGTSLSTSLDEALAYGSGEVPVSTGEEAAPLVGALVVAPGAGDASIRAELTQAVETLLGLAANQVIVLPGRKEGP